MATAFAKSTSPVEMLSHRRAWKVAETIYEVVARAADRRYAVVVVNGVPRCTCQAGERGKPCFHAAAVVRRMQREGVAA